MNIPDECPVCNGPVRTDHSQTHGFVVMLCGSHYGIDGTRQHQSSQCIQSERDQLAAEVEHIRSESDWRLGQFRAAQKLSDMRATEVERLKAENAELAERVKRLEEAGDAMASRLKEWTTCYSDERLMSAAVTFADTDAISHWNEAKEATP